MNKIASHWHRIFIGLLVFLMAAAAGYRYATRATLSVVAQDAAALKIEAETDVPAIALDRLTAERPAIATGQRDIFDFGRAKPSVAALAAAQGPTPMPVIDIADLAPTPAPAPVLPPLAVRFLGMVKVPQHEQAGFWVAALQIGKQEIVTAREGEIVANRYKIIKIGLESIDIQEVGSDSTRRIRLGGS